MFLNQKRWFPHVSTIGFTAPVPSNFKGGPVRPRGAAGGLLGEEEATGTCATQGLEVDGPSAFGSLPWFLGG